MKKTHTYKIETRSGGNPIKSVILIMLTGLIAVICPKVAQASSHQYQSNVKSNGPVQAASTNVTINTVNAGTNNCTATYQSITTPMTDSAWCSPQCSDCAENANGFWEDPWGNFDCGCTTNIYGLVVVTGTKVSVSGSYCLYIDASYYVNGSLDLNLLKGGLAGKLGLGSGTLTVNLGGNIQVGATIPISFTYINTVWDGAIPPVPSC